MTLPRVAPWCGLGTSGSWSSAAEALEEAEMTVTGYTEPVWTNDGLLVPNTYVTRDYADDRLLGVVSGQYGIVQNQDVFGMLDPFCEKGGVIEHAGTTPQGMSFMVCRMESHDWQGDRYDLYACVMNSYNGKYPACLFITTLRVICQNMFAKLRQHAPAMFNLRHTTYAADALRSKKLDVTGALTQAATDIQLCLNMAKMQKVDQATVDKAAELIFPYPKQPDPWGFAKWRDTCDRQDSRRQLWIEECYHAPDNEPHLGTGLGLLNAYYDWLSHYVPLRENSGWEGQRLGGLMLGTNIKNSIMKLVM